MKICQALTLAQGQQQNETNTKTIAVTTKETNMQTGIRKMEDTGIMNVPHLERDLKGTTPLDTKIC